MALAAAGSSCAFLIRSVESFSRKDVQSAYLFKKLAIWSLNGCNLFFSLCSSVQSAWLKEKNFFLCWHSWQSAVERELNKFI